MWLDRQGHVELVTADRRAYRDNFDLSPDGLRLAVSIVERNHMNIWVSYIREQRWQQLTSNADDDWPTWSPTGDRLAFHSNRDGPFNLYVIRPDEASQAERVTHSPNWQVTGAWSRDGKFLAYAENEKNDWDTWILPFDGNRKPWRWGPEQTGAFNPAFSPDGRWLTYWSQETGDTPEVHVRPFRGSGMRQTVSGLEGGVGAQWSSDGREILYNPVAPGDNRVLAVGVTPGPALTFTKPYVAFAPPFARASWALVPGAQRLLTIRRDRGLQPETHNLTLIRNWGEEVKAKLAGAR